MENFINQLKMYDWFLDLVCENKTLYVFVSQMDLNFIANTPHYIDGFRVLFHFKEKPTYKVEIKNSYHVDDESSPDYDLNENKFDYDFVGVLEDLKTRCPINILIDIFYEVHDGKNAVTNYAKKYPEVFIDLEKLYMKYGFDLLYEEIDYYE